MTTTRQVPEARGRVLVVGGGVSGLTAAWSLARVGVAVTLAEAGPTLGGKVSTEHVDGFTIEHGPDSFLPTKPAAITLARELGLDGVLTGVTDPRRVYIRYQGALIPMPEGIGLVLPTRLGPFVRTPLFSWPEKLRIARDLVAPRSLSPGDVAVGAYLRGRLGDSLVDRLAGPLVGGVYNTPIDEVSLDAVVPQLRTAEREHRSLCLAGLAEGRRMRAAAAKSRRGPSLGLFVALRGGMERFVEALAAGASDLGTDLRTSCPVSVLSRAGGGVEATLDGTTERFDHAILATPAPAASTLLGEELPAAAKVLDAIPHGSSVLVTLAYAAGTARLGLEGHGYLIPRTEGGPISACTWSSQKWAERAPQDAILLRLFVRDEPAWTSGPDEAHLVAAQDEVERTLGISTEPTLTRVTRYDGNMPRYTVGHLERVASIEASLAAWPAISLTGASYRGIGLPDCVGRGQAAAAQAAERLDAA